MDAYTVGFRERDKAISEVIGNWKRMKFRCKAAYFVSDEEYELMFGEKRDG